MRYDLSWQALDGALARRAVVARAVAVDAYGGGPEGKRLAALADAAERAPRQRAGSRRERAVGGAGGGRPGVAAGGAGRRVGRRRSAGAAGPPIPQRRRPRHVGAARAARGAAAAARRNRRAANLFRDRRTRRGVAPGRSDLVSRRTSARVVLLDDDGAVLLFCGSDPANEDGTAPRWWFTVGGAAQRGETLAQAAARELAEETGLRVDPADMIGPVWRRDAVIDFNGSVIRSEEMFFVHRTRRFDPSTTRAHRAGAQLHPRPPVVRRGNDRRAGRRAGRPCIRCSWASCWRRPTRWPTRAGAAARRRAAVDPLMLRIKQIWRPH